MKAKLRVAGVPREERVTGIASGVWRLPFRGSTLGHGGEANRGVAGGQELWPEDGGAGQSLPGQ